jgi:peptide/nickel transport system substrate-binding protein
VPAAFRLLALLCALALLAAACGGSDDDSGGGGGGGGDDTEEGTPTPGGTITYALEGNTTQFCIPRAQLAISGILVVEAVYDTLTRPTRNPNEYAPYLAESVEPNEDYTEWTIVIRDGITFHDGTPLTAEIVKQNIDAWREGVLLGFVYQNVTDVAVTAPNTVVVSTEVPWVAFPAYLWVTGRAGIAAPAQLTGPNCDTNMIGTGPFRLESFDPTSGDVSVVKNEDYWRTDSEGRQLPYLDGIDFVPQLESQQRINGLQGGQFDVMHSTGGKDLNGVERLGSQFQTLVEPDGRMEISHALPNVSVPPFDNATCREAIAKGIDREALNAIANDGAARLADQVFDTEIMGYVEDPGFPQYDQEEAQELADQCKTAQGGRFEFDLQSTFDQSTQDLAAEVKRQLNEIGITVNLPAPVDQAQIINQAVGGTVDSFLWRNYPGQDPDTMYVWFYGGSIVNFNHVDDDVLDEALDGGRREPDPDARREHYETFNKRMSEQAYNFWSYYTQWFVGARNNVHGFVGPNLPNAAGEPGDDEAVEFLAGYHQMLGIWKDQ